MNIAGAQQSAICLKQRDKMKGIAARTGRGLGSDNNVRERMNKPSIIELYLTQLLQSWGLLKMTMIDQEEGRLKEDKCECDGLDVQLR